MLKLKLLCYIIIITLLLTPSFQVSAQNISGFNYINPAPNSRYVSVKTKILIRQGDIINRNSVNDGLIKAVGTKSGIHYGKLILADDNKTLVFSPEQYFQTDEDVTVNLMSGLLSRNGTEAGSLSFKFHTSKNISSFNHDKPVSNGFPINNSNPTSTSGIPDTALPSYLPNITIQSNNPSPGYLFISPTPYLMIIDNEGTPVFFRDVGIPGNLYDFDLQPSGELTYFVYPVQCFGLDSSLQFTRNFNTADGFSPDVHELHVFPDGSYYIFGKRLVPVDMSKIVAGGDSTASLIDNALQKFDANGNLIFEWDAIEHYNITDVDSMVNLTQHTIDFSHCNSVTIDSDGNPIISSRNLDEITKIDYNTGDIIWRWGGENNQFTFINDDIGFSRQHFIRLFSNGNFGLFDNGVYHNNRISSGCEYELDQQNKTATLVRRVTNGNIYTSTEGSYQELTNGNRVISWGHNYSPFLTEFAPDNSISVQLSYDRYVDTYRAFRYQWSTNLFITNNDSINFGNIFQGDSSVKNITVYNRKDSIVIINGFYCRDSSFTTPFKLPVTIQPKDSIIIPLIFKSWKAGSFKAAFNIRSFSTYKNSTQMIARQVILSGSTVIDTNIIAAPTDLKAVQTDSGTVKLTWNDNSFNESNFVIQRKNGDTTTANNFTAIDTIAANDTIYFDQSVQKNLTYSYRVFAKNADTVSAYSNIAVVNVSTLVNSDNSIPSKFELSQNYPNPFNPATILSYQVAMNDYVTLKVYNTLGEEIVTLVHEEKSAGTYKVKFNAGNLPSGIYFYQLRAGSLVQTKKMILLK